MRVSRDCFANFVADFRTTFMQVPHECRENFHVSQTRLELVAKVLNMFENLMLFSKIFRKTRATFVRCCEPVAAKFWRIFNAKFSRHSYDSLEKTCENLTTNWRENKTKRHSYECRVTLARLSYELKISYIRGKVVRRSHE